MNTALCLALAIGLAGQASSTAAQDVRDDPDARLRVMKAIATSYRMRPSGDRLSLCQLRPDPVHRFTNPVGQTRDGAIFVWTGEGGRPAAAAQVFERRDGQWVAEFSSLATFRLIASSTSGHEWIPESAGVEFKPFPNAPKPALTAEKRLRQMRELTREIAVEDHFRRTSWQPLRMLTQPFLRYGRDGSDPIDGALFAYVLTTDPEAYVILEARGGADGPAWYYAFAPSTVYAVRSKVKGIEVWSLPHRSASGGPSSDPSATFHVQLVNPPSGP